MNAPSWTVAPHDDADDSFGNGEESTMPILADLVAEHAETGIDICSTEPTAASN